MEYYIYDYTIEGYELRGGYRGVYGITIYKDADSDEFSVFGQDQDGGDHEITDLFDLEDIKNILNNTKV